jgi:hypothetical protein
MGVTLLQWAELTVLNTNQFNPNSIYMQIILGYVPLGIKFMGWAIYTLVIRELFNKFPLIGLAVSSLAYVAVVEP